MSDNNILSPAVAKSSRVSITPLAEETNSEHILIFEQRLENVLDSLKLREWFSYFGCIFLLSHFNDNPWKKLKKKQLSMPLYQGVFGRENI